MSEMKILLTRFLFVSAGMLSPARAEMVTCEEAFTVAENWVALVIDHEGTWGGSETAQVDEIHQFMRGNRLLGYFYHVRPQGYVVISSRRALAPVKAYSDTSQIDPEIDEGMADLIKIRMENTLDAIERQAHTGADGLGYSPHHIPEMAHRYLWDLLSRPPSRHEVAVQSELVALNYAGGSPPLLSSRWHQGDAYNRMCPRPVDGPNCPTVTAALVGCGPLAAAQVMRYWAWPPGFDWINMPDSLWSWSPQDQINAVADLCSTAGRNTIDPDTGLGAYYGCEGTSTNFCHLLGAMTSVFQYSPNANVIRRDSSGGLDGATWFNLARDELNSNRPILYAVEGHTLVCDGWREIEGSQQLHMNYGDGGGSSTTWWTLDMMPGSAVDHDAMQLAVRPSCAEGPTVIGIRTWQLGGLNHAYFDQDCVSLARPPLLGIVRYSGYNCQFLPHARLTAGNADIEFVGMSASDTCLFSIKGTSAATAKVRLGSMLRLRQGGSIRFH
jgi:hypothetical protein